MSTVPIFQVSECPSAKKGGSLGVFKRGVMVAEFDRVCFEEKVGVGEKLSVHFIVRVYLTVYFVAISVHGPVDTQFGSHLIYVLRRTDGDQTEIAEEAAAPKGS